MDRETEGNCFNIEALPIKPDPTDRPKIKFRNDHFGGEIFCEISEFHYCAHYSDVLHDVELLFHEDFEREIGSVGHDRHIYVIIKRAGSASS